MQKYFINISVDISGKKFFGDTSIKHNKTRYYSWGDWTSAESKEDCLRQVKENWPEGKNIRIRTEAEIDDDFLTGKL